MIVLFIYCYILYITRHIYIIMKCSTWNISIKIVYILVNHEVLIHVIINQVIEYIDINLKLFN